MKALISVSNRVGVAEFAQSLHQAGFELVSTGGTGQHLVDSGLPVTQVADVTGFPEILNGRVKTLHPKIHGGILARRETSAHMDQLEQLDIDTIDLVVVNLYPFVQTVQKKDTTLEDALENIDIGGPTLIRAAAKNFLDVLVVVDPGDYDWMSGRMGVRGDGLHDIGVEERRELARKAFQHVAWYDTAVARYLENSRPSGGELTLGYTRISELRYGENPHQVSGLYGDSLSTGGIVRAKKLHGIDLSFTNFLDADAAWQAVSDFNEPAAVVVKHTNPCGLAVHSNQAKAYVRSFEGDSVSAYGGIVGFNREVTSATAEAMKGVLYHIIVAPGYQPDALEILKKRKQIRILQVEPAIGSLADTDVRSISGGILIQTADVIDEDPDAWKVVTDRKPTQSELEDMAFAWKASKHIKSNTIVLAKDNTMMGMGSGQPNRVTSVELALRIAGEKAIGSSMASDAFMPFKDNVEIAAAGGVSSIVQPGGSIRDDEVIESANGLGIAMVFTGVRHFKH